MENFQAVADEFQEAGALATIAGTAELVPALEHLLADPDAAQEIGERARQAAQARRGATARAASEMRVLYDANLPRYRSAQPLCALRQLLSYVWLAGAAWKRRRQLRNRRTLPVPVISIGNLTMGGTGKTPCVLAISRMLEAAGRRSGILTRGYGRGTLHQNLVLAPGACIEPEHSGDEPQIFIRAGVAPVGIGADRFATGTQLIAEFGVDTLLLDDGFQHWKLARDLDVVLIDALNPIAGGGVFPAGRLREPLSGIARANVVVITRAESSDLATAIEREVRRYNPSAPVFCSSVHPEVWVEHRSERPVPLGELPPGPAAAFCGLGNPESFRRTLERLGIELADWVEFGDHHRYRTAELTRLAHQFRAHGVTTLLTTEKDTINLCDGCDDLLAPMTLYWLRIGMKIEREAEFAREILRVCAVRP
jgi:tetraacyldisaccharide 4'-kinase